jgi:hypothetical protein
MISLAVSFGTRYREGDELMKHRRVMESPRLSVAAPGQLRAAVLLIYLTSAVEVIGGLVAARVGLIAYPYLSFILAVAGVWIWMVKPIREGRQLARTAGTTFFLVNTIATMVMVMVELIASSVHYLWAILAIEVLRWMLALAVVILIWTSESDRYYEAMAVQWDDIRARKAARKAEGRGLRHEQVHGGHRHREGRGTDRGAADPSRW